MENNNLKNSVNSTRDLLANAGPAIAQGMQTLGYLSQENSFVATAVCALLSVWGNFANKKASDFMKQFKDNEDRLISEITHSDKFVSVFLEIFDRNIKESNEEKRQYLKSYILNFATGVEPSFNEHTKLIFTLNHVTLEEIEMLRLWDNDGAIERQYKLLGDTPNKSIRDNALDINGIENIIHSQKPQLKMIKFDGQNRSKNNQILFSLGYKGLLYVLGADNFGSGVEAKTKNLTDFGKIFLKFIKSNKQLQN